MRSVPQVELRRVYRQAERTGIPAVARAIREGTLPRLPAPDFDEGSGVYFAPRRIALTTDDVLDLLADLGGFRHDVRILCATRAGAAGVEAINARLHAAVARGLRPSPDSPSGSR
jgi:exodeoxyribonuclease V alpha subunit